MSALDNIAVLKDRVVDKLPLDEALPAFDLEMDMLLMQARDLLTRAGTTLAAAYTNLAEAPDDVIDAIAAVALAKETETRISAMAKDKQCGKEGRGLASALLCTTSAALNQATMEVDTHEAGNSTESSKRMAHAAALQKAKSEKAAPKDGYGKPVKKKNLLADIDDDDEDHRKPRKKLTRKLGEDDDNDERDNFVGKGKHRRARKATSEYGRKATRILGGVMDEGTADEIVSTVGTAKQRMSEGLSGIISGDVEASDAGALATARGIRNALRDDIGVDDYLGKGTSEKVAGVMRGGLQATGRAAITVRETTVGAAKYVGDAADDARDAAADNYHKMWKFGRELNQLLPGLQANAKTRKMYDTDGDGKVELHEVVGVLGKYGIKDMKNVDFNGDGDITYAEIGAAIKSRGKAPVKH